MTTTARAERGSGVVLAVAVMAVAVTVGAVAVLVVDLLRTAQRAQHVANLAAVAASDVAIGVVSGRPCVVARQIARDQQMSLDSCEVAGGLATVAISLHYRGLTIDKRAAAAPQSTGVWSSLREGESGTEN